MIPIRDTAPCHKKPLITFAVIGLCVFIFALINFVPDQIAYHWLNQYGMVPIRYSNPQWANAYGLANDHYLSFLTNLFIHADWTHLLMNMWFMWIFADNVEDRMGRFSFLVFFLLCGLFATFLQWYFVPKMTVPVIGASGAIAGVLGAYFFLYPLERVVVWIPFIFPIILQVPAIGFLGLWLILQLDNATGSIFFSGVKIEVAWWSHLGGFLAGLLFHPLFLREQSLIIKQEN